MAAESDQGPVRYGTTLGGAVLILLIMLMLCLTALLSVSIWSGDRKETEIATAGYNARTAEAVAEQQKNQVYILMQEAAKIREQLEEENRRQVGGPSTKKKRKK